MYSFALLGFYFLAGMPSILGAQEVEAEDSSVHVVRTGDTLWDLAGRYLTDPFLWPEIFAANRGVVQDPHWIFPRDRLLIPRRDAARTATFGRPAEPDRFDPMRPSVFAAPSVAGEAATPAGRLVSRDQAPVVPSGAFHGAGVLVPPEELGQVGSIVDLVGASVLDLRSKPQIQPFDQVYLDLTDPVSAGDRVQFMRPDRLVAPYGRIFVATGGGVVLRVDGQVAIVEVDRFYDRVDIGDLVVRPGEYSVVAGATPQPATGLVGSILAFEVTQPIPATEDLVFLNLGEASGVQVGDVFEVFLAPEEVGWGTRPEVVVGRLQVVRTARLTSAARVTALEQPALQAGLPVRLIAKMP